MRVARCDMAANNQEKDGWDKFGIVTQFVSGVVIAIAGGVFSYSYQSQQTARERQAAELQRVQTIGTFMPFLTSKDAETKQLALTQVQSLQGTQNAVNVALQVNAAAQANAPSSTGGTESAKPDPAVASALRVIAKQANSDSDRKYATDALMTLVCGHSVGGDTRRKWLELGGETGQIGCPVEDEQDAPKSPQGTEGRYAKFHGTDHPYYIFWHKNGPHAGKSFVVYGKIGVIYDRMGKSKSWLGFPISDEHEMPGGATGWRQSDFEGGRIAWSQEAQDYAAMSSN